MDKVVVLVTQGPGGGARSDDDVIDRLNHRYTVVVLVVSALIITVTTWIGSPITCWAPVHFTGSHTKFANSYCWVRNTYYLPWEEDVPRPDEHREVITYYQWVPFILLAQAVLFYAPTLVWHMFNSKAGVDSDNILATANSFRQYDKVEGKEKTLQLVVSQMDRFLESRPTAEKPKMNCDINSILSATCCRLCGKRY